MENRFENAWSTNLFSDPGTAINVKPFPYSDTALVLDYEDSNGERHPTEIIGSQAIAKIKEEFPCIQSASLEYRPNNQSGVDNFNGTLEFSPNQYATRIPTRQSLQSTLHRVLRNKLFDTFELLTPSDSSTIIFDLTTKEIIGTVGITGSSNLNIFSIAFDVPSNFNSSYNDRYADVRFAAELWSILADFAIRFNDYYHYDCSSDLPETVQINAGGSYVNTINRFSISLLTSVCDFQSKYITDEKITLDKINYATFQQITKEFSDQDLASVFKYAISQAYLDGGMLSDRHIKRALYNFLRTSTRPQPLSRR